MDGVVGVAAVAEYGLLGLGRVECEQVFVARGRRHG